MNFLVLVLFANAALLLTNRASAFRISKSFNRSILSSCGYRLLQRVNSKRAITRLKIKAWYEDDLPNILGINPIEAAIIFGVLYYVYGPNVLYEYAREAGKLFSTYAPIVRDVSFDIFNEFRDYFEEERYCKLRYHKRLLSCCS
jgi:hypothetical protein